MIVRLWTTRIDERRAHEYDAFAHQESLPMFKRQPGNLGVFFARDRERCAVISLWATRSAVDALASSKTYQRVSSRIKAPGFLVGEPVIQSWSCDDGWLDPSLVDLLGLAEHATRDGQHVR